jgi:uncharacterized membrane protein
MDLPIDFQINYIWVVLIFSFILVPLILIIFKRWMLVISQTLIIACVSTFVTYLNITGIDMSSNDMYFGFFYFSVFIYFSLGLYALLESLYRKFAT